MKNVTGLVKLYIQDSFTCSQRNVSISKSLTLPFPHLQVVTMAGRTSESTIASTHSSPCTTLVQNPSVHSSLSSVTNSKASLPKRAAHRAKSAWFTFSDWLMEWTPFCLVVSYFVVCTAIFVMCSTEAITVFYYFYMVANLYIAVVAVIESFLGMSPGRKAQAIAEKAQHGGFPTASDRDLPTMNMVMVAYLPNEKDIVMGQLMYALEELVYPKDKLHISTLIQAIDPLN
jgi:hypothetical protein